MLAKIGTSELGILLVLLVLLLTSIFGLGIIMGSTQDGEMAGCPLTSGPASMCQMNVIEHISYWQQLFTAKVSDINSLILWLLTILFVLTFPSLYIRNKDRTPLDLSFYLYNKSKPQTHLFNYLNLLFSKGILQPKIY